MGKSSGGTKSKSWRNKYINSESLEGKVVDYVMDNVNSFSSEEEDYMMRQATPAILYRYIDSYSEEAELAVGEEFSYDRIKSFSAGEDGLTATLRLASDSDDIEDGVVLRVVNGKGYNIKPIVKKNEDEFGRMAQDYVSQNEHLSKGTFKVKSINQKVVAIDGKRYQLKMIDVEFKNKSKKKS